ncbi:MAG: hypothetical protein ABR498_05980 [Candidatus Dormibacteria bacterium]
MIARGVGFWWRRLPARLARLSPAAAMVLIDGRYVTRQRVLGALVPPAAIVVGFLVGWLHPLEHDVYTTSALFMSLALVIGTLSAALGAWLVLGYAVGDLVLANRSAAFVGSLGEAGKTWATLILCDIVLAMMVVLIPLTARALSHELMLRLRRGGSLVVEYAVAAGVSALMVYAWSQAAPVLTRPYFTWHGVAVARDALDSLQLMAWLLPLVGLVAMVLRGWLEQRVQLEEVASSPAQRVRRRALPVPIAIAWKVGLAVFVLAGLMEFWVDPIVVALVMATFLVVREPALRRLPADLQRVTRVPILPRLIVGAVTSAVLGIIFVSIFGADSVVRPIVLSTLLSLTVFTLLLPEHVLETEPRERTQP